MLDLLPRFVIVLLVDIVLNCFYRTLECTVDNIKFLCSSHYSSMEHVAWDVVSASSLSLFTGRLRFVDLNSFLIGKL